MKQFLKGWANYILNLNTEAARKKARICIECDFIKKGIFEVVKDNKIQEIEGAVCGVCNCPLTAKLRSNDKCPKGKF